MKQIYLSLFFHIGDLLFYGDSIGDLLIHGFLLIVKWVHEAAITKFIDSCKGSVDLSRLCFNWQKDP